MQARRPLAPGGLAPPRLRREETDSYPPPPLQLGGGAFHLLGEEMKRNRTELMFLVAIDGIDRTLVLRKGTLTRHEITLEVVPVLGPLGTSRWLRLASADRAHEVRIAARITRTELLEDAGGTPAARVTLTFSQANEEDTRALAALAHHIRVVEKTPLPGLLRATGASTLAGLPHRGAPQQSVRSMRIEATWNVPVGQPLSVEIMAPGMARPTRLEGRVVHVEARTPTMDGPLYAIEIALEAETISDTPLTHDEEESGVRPAPGAALAASPGDEEDWFSFGALFADLTEGSPSSSATPEHEHLRGALSRIPLATVCSLIEMDRLSGKLTLTREGERAVLYAREGRFVDVRDDDSGRTPRERLWDLLTWKRGTFDLDLCPVTRPDLLNFGMTEMLIEHARSVDEAAAARA